MKKLLPILLLFGCLSFGQEIRRPTADVDNSSSITCSSTGTATGSVAVPNFYDSSGNTTNSVMGIGDGGGGAYGGRMFQTWASASGGYSALNLIVDISLYVESPGNSGAEYSTDGGSTWTTIASRFSAGTTARQAYSISLSPAQSLASLKVKVCAYNNSVGASNVTGWDVRTEGVLGSNKRRVVVVQ